MSGREVFPVDGARMPFLKLRGTRGPFTPVHLAVQCGRPLVARQPVAPETCAMVILGCVNVVADEMNPARVAALRPGTGAAMVAFTVQITCGSGMQSLDTAFRRIREGRSDLILAGGTEARSHAQMIRRDEAVDWRAGMQRSSGPLASAQSAVQIRRSHLRRVIGLERGLTEPAAMTGVAPTPPRPFIFPRVSSGRVARSAMGGLRAPLRRRHGPPGLGGTCPRLTRRPTPRPSPRLDEGAAAIGDQRVRGRAMGGHRRCGGAQASRWRPRWRRARHGPRARRRRPDGPAGPRPPRPPAAPGAWRGSARSGACPGPVSIVRGGWRRILCRSGPWGGADRSLRPRTRSCSTRSAPTSPARPGRAKATARSGHGGAPAVRPSRPRCRPGRPPAPRPPRGPRAWGGGSGFLADAFQRQIRARGITPSCAFVGEPATNAVVERFFRTLRARIGHGRVCKTIEDVRKAVRDAFARYTVAWPLEKNGCLSPHALGHRPDLAAMPAPAQHTHVSKEPGAGQSRNARRRIALGHAVSVTPLHPLPGKRESVALRAEA